MKKVQDGPKLVKRYANRKLYDVEDSRYTSLLELTGIIMAGREVKVIDQNTGKDATSVTLFRALSKLGEKGMILDLGTFRSLVNEELNSSKEEV